MLKYFLELMYIYVYILILCTPWLICTKFKQLCLQICCNDLHVLPLERVLHGHGHGKIYAKRVLSSKAKLRSNVQKLQFHVCFQYTCPCKYAFSNSCSWFSSACYLNVSKTAFLDLFCLQRCSKHPASMSHHDSCASCLCWWRPKKNHVIE